MNINDPKTIAAEFRAIREQVDRLRYGLLTNPPTVNAGNACRLLIARLRKNEAMMIAAASTAPLYTPPIVETVSIAAPGPTVEIAFPSPEPSPIEREAPPPKRKPGRPRKNPPPAEAGGVA